MSCQRLPSSLANREAGDGRQALRGCPYGYSLLLLLLLTNTLNEPINTAGVRRSNLEESASNPLETYGQAHRKREAHVEGKSAPAFVRRVCSFRS